MSGSAIEWSPPRTIGIAPAATTSPTVRSIASCVAAPALERVDHAAQSYDRSVARNSEEILSDAPPPAADARLAYGAEPKQFGDLRLPEGDSLWPLAVVVHGGSWKAMYNLIHT